jgi:hypothetical protein
VPEERIGENDLDRASHLASHPAATVSGLSPQQWLFVQLVLEPEDRGSVGQLEHSLDGPSSAPDG